MSDKFKNRIVGSDVLNPKDIKKNAKNWRKHPELQQKALHDVLNNVGWVQDVIINKTTGNLVDGHLRVETALKNKEDEIPVKYVELTDEEEQVVLATFDPISAMAEKDNEMFKQLIDEIQNSEFEIDTESMVKAVERESADDNIGKVRFDRENPSKLSDRFVVTPVTLLDTRQGVWAERKRVWRNIIKDDGSSRGTTCFSKSIGIANTPLVSVLDSVLAEVVSTWYKPETTDNPKSFDVFAGDTVFGYVSSYLGWDFTGIELRETQASFNQSRVSEAGLSAKYICDDGRNVLNHIDVDTQDLLFSCPPYYDLEVYSDMENDASNQETYEDFYKILDRAFSAAIKCLKNNRFAVIVCGDVRNKKNGAYYDFPGDIKRTFMNNGMILYNELILINQYGSAGMRCSHAMRNRKCVKVHQNVLVFYKGDTSKIQDEFGIIEVGSMEDFVSDESNLDINCDDSTEGGGGQVDGS